MESGFDHTDNIYSEWTSEEYPEIGDLELPRLKDFINNSDYTLDSPLLPDQLSNLIAYLEEGRKDPLHYHPSWDEVSSWAQSVHVIPRALVRVSDIHKALFGHLARMNPRLFTRANNLIDTVDNDACNTFEVLRIYVLHWLQKHLRYESRKYMNVYTISMLQIFIEFHILTCFINAKQELEIQSLLDGGLGIQKDIRRGIYFESEIFGKIWLTKGYCFIPELNLLLDRDLVLMMKDMGAARYQTLMNIESRYESDYDSRHLDIIIDLYRSGDRLLGQYGNRAYNIMAAVEPHCNGKFVELAALHRPLVPPFPRFEEHLVNTRRELEMEMPGAEEFLLLIKNLDNLQVTLTAYGCFRHWGHPFIDYEEGLRKLHENVTKEVEVDEAYAEKLASNLAKKVLKDQFHKKKQWFVDINHPEEFGVLDPHIRNNTWPPPAVIDAFGPRWHLLPLTQCFDIPELSDPSLIYSDKSYSMNLSEIVNHLNSDPYRRLESRKVLDALIKLPPTNFKELLREIDEHGLEKDHLAIGLSAKERELKIIGRFFALMTWKLREYFVFTEYLIKTHFVPLFSGLTMSDDHSTLVKKLIECTSGQGIDGCDSIGISNHIDYRKWNNMQRDKATKPTFTVMDKFFGYKRVISRTHEFFENSLIYYKARPDWLTVSQGEVTNRSPEHLGCWQGQAGGLEGLRQKGWSILSLLMIEEQADFSNVNIKVLAQGDNQVICCNYTPRYSRTEEELVNNLRDIVNNNDRLISSVRIGIEKLGLVINEDETMQSADFTNYGKVVIFRGHICCLEEKRYSRVTCSANDQLLTIGSTLSAVSTNCLTVAHFSKSPIRAMIQYNWLANFVRRVLELYHPGLCSTLKALVSKHTVNPLESVFYKIAYMSLDPSLGGVGGMSYARFHVRAFPDAVTESLSFWKVIADHTTSEQLRAFAIEMGHPRLLRYEDSHFIKLIEDPSALNIPKSISAMSVLKEQVKLSLINRSEEIGNHMIRTSLEYYKENYDQIVIHLSTITPCFPRFVSEMYGGTACGIFESLISLFENSRSIRNKTILSNYSDIHRQLTKSELASFVSLVLKSTFTATQKSIWACSADHADNLRNMSFARKIIGSTVPHPLEMFGLTERAGDNCRGCTTGTNPTSFITTIIPQPFTSVTRGKYPPYLGSRTQEMTTILKQWEKETRIPFVKRASDLRRVIKWFVDPDSNLAKSIFKMIESSTGELHETSSVQGIRSGSAPHRFRNYKTSSGGYCANSPSYSSQMIVTTDSMSDLGDTNYDFMFQCSIIFAQQTASLLHEGKKHGEIYHTHISNSLNLREITEPDLDCPYVMTFSPIHHLLSKWKPDSVEWFESKVVYSIPLNDWTALSQFEQSYQIGRAHGFCYGEQVLSHRSREVNGILFPVGTSGHLYPQPFLAGLLDGVMRAAALNSIHKRNQRENRKPRPALSTLTYSLLNKMCQDNAFINMTRHPNFQHELMSTRYKVPAEYPSSNLDTGNQILSYFTDAYELLFVDDDYKTKYQNIWLFTDLQGDGTIGLFIMADKAIKLMFKRALDESSQRYLVGLAEISGLIREGKAPQEDFQSIMPITRAYMSGYDIRSACKEIHVPTAIARPKVWLDHTQMPRFGVTAARVHYMPIPTTSGLQPPGKYQMPLVSGLRIIQRSTGMFYKLEELLRHFVVSCKDFICGGDGSGGGTAHLLNRYPSSRGIFNSLPDITKVALRGTRPSPPAAVEHAPGQASERCVNFFTAWKEPSDLRERSTWDNFMRLKRNYNLSLNLAVFDMEVMDYDSIKQIMLLLSEYLPRIMDHNSTIIVKSYVAEILSERSPLHLFFYKMNTVHLTQTGISSSKTSEVYIVGQNFKSDYGSALFPDLELLSGFLSSCYCYRSFQDEFRRACSIQEKPNRIFTSRLLMPDPIAEFRVDLQAIGIRGAVISQISQMWGGHGTIKGHECILLTMALVSNDRIEMNRPLHQAFQVPNDQTCLHILTIMLGFHMWLAMDCKNERLAQTCQNFLNDTITIWLGVKEVKIRGERLHVPIWSLSKMLQKRKTFHLDDKIAKIGRIIRFCQRRIPRSSHREPINWDFINHTLANQNRRLDMGMLEERTGLFDLMDPSFRQEVYPVNSGFEVVNPEVEPAWDS